MHKLSVIFGLSGFSLTQKEKYFFKEVNPWAFILFKRNVLNKKQLIKLTSDLRQTLGRNCLIFIDQEGGRVQRLSSPNWQIYPSGSFYNDLYSVDKGMALRSAYLAYSMIADDLRECGITANCAPVLDIPVERADPIISDRAYGKNPSQVIDIANAVMSGLMSGGVVPVIKHIPGHGRARVDSHKELPIIPTKLQTLRNSDFIPFQALKDAPMAMTAHAVYECSSKSPLTISRKSFDTLIRKEIGYTGLVMSDDLDMKALSGDLIDRTRASLNAGCDIALQCSGNLDSMNNVAKGAKTLDGISLNRATIAEYCSDIFDCIDREGFKNELNSLTAFHHKHFEMNRD